MGNYSRGSYHSNGPAWRATRLKGKYIGIELEVYHPDSYRNTLQALPNVRRNQRRPITEEDGSLDDYRGVEIVFPPYKYSQLRNHRSFFHTALAEMQKAGTRGRSGYGMHMNVNTSDWKDDKKAAFHVVLSSVPTDWIRNIGGRSRGQEGVVDWRGYVGHYYVARLEAKPGRTECRFPQSCVDSERVMNLVDFIALVEKYAGSKRGQRELKKIVDDTIRERRSYGLSWDTRTRFDEVTRVFSEWLDEQSKKNETAKRILGVLEKGYDDKASNSESRSAGEAPAKAKPWCANNPDNLGKEGTYTSDAEYDEEDYDSDCCDDPECESCYGNDW